MLHFHRPIPIALVAIAAGCSNGGSSKSVSETRVSRTGAIVADPARNRIYVADVDHRRLVAFDSSSAALAGEAPFDAEPEGVASDARGERVYVTLPTLHRIVVLDATTFAEVQAFDSVNALHAIAWRDNHRVVVVTDVGLALVDVDAATEQTIIPDTPGNGLIVHDSKQRRVWTAFSLDGQLGVATIDPDLPGDEPFGELLFPSVDPPVSLALTFDETSLLVGSDVDATLYVVDAATLAVSSTVPLPPVLVALGSNVESTRLFSSPGDPSANELAADSYTGVEQYVASNAILPRGVVVDTISSNLMVHLADSTMEALPLFDDTLVGLPNLVTGTSYTLTLTGPPGAHYFLVGSARPGFIHYGPSSAQPTLFADLDPTTLLVLAQGQLDGAGQATFTGTVLPASFPEGTRYYLQAVVVDPATMTLRAPTNPMRVTIFDPSPP